MSGGYWVGYTVDATGESEGVEVEDWHAARGELAGLLSDVGRSIEEPEFKYPIGDVPPEQMRGAKFGQQSLFDRTKGYTDKGKADYVRKSLAGHILDTDEELEGLQDYVATYAPAVAEMVWPGMDRKKRSPSKPAPPETQSSTPLFDESGVGQTLLGGSEDLIAPRARKTQSVEDFNVAPKSKIDPNARPEDFVFGVPGGVVEPERERDRQALLFSAKGNRRSVKYAAKGGKWVTIGEGKGGASVYVVNGIIRKGCPELMGQEVEEIEDTEVGTGSHADHGLEVGDIQPGHSTADKKAIIAAEPENKGPAPKSPAMGGDGKPQPAKAKWRLKRQDVRGKRQESLDSSGYERFKLHRDARKEGFTREDVAAMDKMAMSQVAESEQDAANFNNMLGYARQVTGRSGKGKEFAGGDASNVKKIDDVAQELANSAQYGHYFTPDDQGEPYSDQLHSFMSGGNRQPKSYDDAWDDVMEYARESRGTFAGSATGGQEDAVPFSAKANRANRGK
jgi:hypothetical protein